MDPDTALPYGRNNPIRQKKNQRKANDSDRKVRGSPINQRGKANKKHERDDAVCPASPLLIDNALAVFLCFYATPYVGATPPLRGAYRPDKD